MVQWIFVINDTEQEFAKRIEERRWPIFKKTQNRRKLKVGDTVIFYKAGTQGKKFLGSSVIGSPLEKANELVFFLKLSDIVVWKKPVEVNEVLKDLDFIRDKQYWGRYFQGGVRRLSETDYETIVAKSKIG